MKKGLAIWNRKESKVGNLESKREQGWQFWNQKREQGSAFGREKRKREEKNRKERKKEGSSLWKPWIFFFVGVLSSRYL